MISAVDLFCGAGGLTHGLERAGINVVCGVDCNPDVKYAYEKNNKAKLLLADVATLDASRLEAALFGSKVTMIAGSPPCQPFSMAMGGRDRDAHVSRYMLAHFTRLIEATRPDIVLMENVRGALTFGKDTFSDLVRTLLGLGYHVDYRVVPFETYGLPQRRARLILLASRFGGIAVQIGPYRTPGEWRTVRDAIGGLPNVEPGQCDPQDRLHCSTNASHLLRARTRHLPKDGGGMENVPIELLPPRVALRGAFYKDIYSRLWWDKPSGTLTTKHWAGNGRNIHPEADRELTQRERALLQGFPRDYDFWPADKPVNIAKVSKLIGNAVPPLVAYELGKAIIEHVRANACARDNRCDAGNLRLS